MMSGGDGGKLGRKRIRDRVAARIRNFDPRARSRPPPITPCAQAPNGSPTARLSAPSHTFANSTTPSPTGTGAGSATFLASTATTWQPTATPSASSQTPPTPTDLPQTLSPLEIRQRTADLLKERLTPEEVGEIKWDETTPEQAKAVVEEVRKSMEGKPEHTGKMYKTLQYINTYSKIIDVAIQHQPYITALVWAGVRTVIQVCGWLLFLNICPSGIRNSLYAASSGNVEVYILHTTPGLVYLTIALTFSG